MSGKIKTREILKKAEFKEGNIDRTLNLASGSKSTRRSLVRSGQRTEDVQIAAAIEIQRLYRGYCTRCRLLNVVEPKLSKMVVFSESKGRLQDVRTPSPQKVPKTKQSKARVRLQQYYENYVNRMYSTSRHPDAVEIISFESFCANYIQNWWHHTRQQRKGKVSPGTQSPSTVSQPQKKRDKPLTKHEAATMIQKSWRRHIDVQVFKYYRDLINFRQRGDPTMMLRCINPNEAKLLDAASGIHIKFRLAGDRFPPNIYYKVFTHRPVQDLCANSPKDYTRADTKRRMARDIHNKGNRVPKTDQGGWYNRMENNGWRLVSDRLIMMSDPVTYESSKKKVEFHHNKLKRREDVERKRKQKKVEWMMKMYKQGMLKARVSDAETVELIEGAAEGMVATIDQHGPESVQDWEVEELLDWTTSLNFDDYLTTWKEVATSATSEKPVYERVQLHAAYSFSDPFELTLAAVSNSNKRDGSTRQSHNTPVSCPSAGSERY